MLSANEARKKATEVNGGNYIAQTATITKAIEKAIKAGKYNVCVDGQLDYAVKSDLILLGYGVTTYTMCGEHYTEIHW